MYLVDLDQGARIVTPQEARQNKYVDHIIRNLDHRTVVKMANTFNTEVGNQVALGSARSSKLAFIKTGMVVGHYSNVPTADLTHIWNFINKLYPLGASNKLAQSRNQKFALGAFFRWQMSMRSESYWLTNREETDLVDPLSGETIWIARYWWKPDYVPQQEAQSTLHKRVDKGLDRAYRDYNSDSPMFAAMQAAMTKNNWNRLEKR